MSFSLYFENLELNKNDPDYQIEDFWYGLKNSMKKFYKTYNFKIDKVDIWSKKLNEYKKNKEYSLIEATIKDCIANYAIDIMKNDIYTDYSYSNILMTNMKRWEKIANKFHFGNSQTNKIIYSLFEAYNCIKLKIDPQLFSILELFKDLDVLFLNNFNHLIYLSFDLGQIKMLKTIEQIIGKQKVYDCIKNNYSELGLNDRDYTTTYLKLYRKYKKMYKD